MTNNIHINNILEFFAENEILFTDCIEELDSYNGYLCDDRCYPMSELDELLAHKTPTEILQLAFYGRDDDNWHTDSHGDKVYGEFNPNREYFYFNGYGNLVSTDYIDYSNYLCDSTIIEMFENRDEIYTIDNNEELKALFDELEA